LTNEKNKYYSHPIWKCKPLGFLKNELKGYLQKCPEKNKKEIAIDVESYQGALPKILKIYFYCFFFILLKIKDI